MDWWWRNHSSWRNDWEEQRYIMKCFTKSWNPEQATTDYGFASEYWFNYGWSVGGDVMGFDGEEYDLLFWTKIPIIS